MTVAELDRPIQLLVEVTAEGTSSVLTLRGEADTFTLPAVVGGLTRAISESDGPVIVDLTETSFIDIATLRAFSRAAQFLARRERTLTVRGPSRMALHLLEFVGLSMHVRVVGDKPTVGIEFEGTSTHGKPTA